MACFRALAEPRLLHLDEVADVRAFFDHAVPPQVCEGSDRDARADCRVADPGLHHVHSIRQGRVDDRGVGADNALFADGTATVEVALRVDGRIGFDADADVDVGRGRVDDGDAGE